jgi:glycosyltransferase involved in cell wall biosynthesis
MTAQVAASPTPFDLTVVCAVTHEATELVQIYEEAREALEPTRRSVEYLFVVPGRSTVLDAQIAAMQESPGHPVRVLRLARDFGESAALQVGFEHARGRFVLTLTDHRQVDFAVLPRILELLERGEKIVTVRRDPRHDALFSRLQSRAFNAISQFLVGEKLQDIACGVRGLTRQTAIELDLYGDQHRFIPLLAIRRGYDVREIPAPQHRADRSLKIDPIGSYIRRLLDIVAIFFLTRFSRKPLRFFGLIGGGLGLAGFVICAVLAVQRLLNLTALGDRPLLLLGVLLIVLGVQMASLGLLGELIIFLSTRRETPQVIETTGPGKCRESAGEPGVPTTSAIAGR